MELKPKVKCLVKLVRDKCDFLGIWNPNWGLASRYIGEKVCENDLLSIDQGRQFVKMKDGKIYCIGFVEFHYGKISENPPPGARISAIHVKVLEELDKRGLKLETLKSYSKYPIDTLSYREIKNKETETEEEIKNKETEESPPEISHRYVQAIRDTCINIPKLQFQLTNEQAETLEREFGDVIVKDVIDSMENSKDLVKKYQSVYLTARSWCKRRLSDGTVLKLKNNGIIKRLPTDLPGSATVEPGKAYGDLRDCRANGSGNR